MDPQPGRVAETISALAAKRDVPLSAYWLQVTGDRDEYAARLTALLAGTDTAVLVVRGAMFDNPNALMNDVVRLLNANRETFLPVFGDRPAERVGMVLLARTELKIPQSSSPVIWPEWLPEVGGRQVACFIRDITRSINVPLNAPELEVGRLNRALYLLEGALIRRLSQVTAVSPHAHVELYRFIRRRSDPGGWHGFLAYAKAALAKADSSDAYRPKVRDGVAVTARLWEVAQCCTAEDLQAVAGGLGAALQVTEDDLPDTWREGFFGVLARPASALGTPADRLLRDTVLMVGNACQLITCSAHAGEYAAYPVNLVSATADELYQGLTRAETMVNHLPDVMDAVR